MTKTVQFLISRGAADTLARTGVKVNSVPSDLTVSRVDSGVIRAIALAVSR